VIQSVLKLVAVVAIVLPLQGCLVLRQDGQSQRARTLALTACHHGETTMQRSTLYFGAAIPNSDDTVDAGEWQRFLDETVTPKFPDGLTWAPAQGQWRGADGRVIGEDSRVLVLLHDDKPATRKALAAVADEYRRRFSQEAVLHERSAACVRF
jgi:hypothetical protein